VTAPDGRGTPPCEPGPCLGVDLGEVRIGVAITDGARTLAVPRGVVARSGNEERDHEALARLVDEVGATLVVVGVPFSLDGRIGPAAARVITETARLAAALRVPVETIDERFSTVEAARRRSEADPVRTGRGGARGHRRRRGPSRAGRTPIDADAAAVILQTYIDRARAT
jgi:putative Holliday junction resolvase